MASHPGNTNAVKHGLYSNRIIAARGAELEAELVQSFDFSVVERVVVAKLARNCAMLEAIDRDIDDRGVVVRNKQHPLLEHRLRLHKHIDQALAMIAPTIERQRRAAQEPVTPERGDYLNELRWIALGQGAAATVRNQLVAIGELRELKELNVRHDAGVGSVTIRIVPDENGKDRVEVVDAQSDSDDGSAAVDEFQPASERRALAAAA
jgi:hypothetical protein